MHLKFLSLLSKRIFFLLGKQFLFLAMLSVSRVWVMKKNVLIVVFFNSLLISWMRFLLDRFGIVLTHFLSTQHKCTHVFWRGHELYPYGLIVQTLISDNLRSNKNRFGFFSRTLAFIRTRATQSDVQIQLQTHISSQRKNKWTNDERICSSMKSRLAYFRSI